MNVEEKLLANTTFDPSRNSIC